MTNWFSNCSSIELYTVLGLNGIIRFVSSAEDLLCYDCDLYLNYSEVKLNLKINIIPGIDREIKSSSRD